MVSRQGCTTTTLVSAPNVWGQFCAGGCAPPFPPPKCFPAAIVREALWAPAACCFAPQVSKYGKVESVRVEVVAGAVKVYVTCVTEEDVAAAIKQLHRRYFGGRVISARAVPM